MTYSAKTSLYAMVGKPIRHSLSPEFYNLAFDAFDIDSVCVAFELDENDAQKLIDTASFLDIKGLSVTMPLKTSMAGCVDELSLQAGFLNAVNAVVFKDTKATGHNTDGKGLINLLEKNSFSYKNERVLMSGLGGAGRAVALELILEGVGHLLISVLDEERAMAERFLQTLRSLDSCPELRLIETREETLLEELNKGVKRILTVRLSACILMLIEA